MEIEKRITIAQQEKFKGSNFNNFPKLVVAIIVSIANPTTSDNVKNLFLNGLVLKQNSLVRAVNI